MRTVVFKGAACILAALTAACAEPPVTPIPDAARRSINAVSADISGIKDSDTSKLGARGSDEGGRLGALQGAATVLRGSSSLLGLLLTPVGAAIGGAKGAAEAQSVEVVDKTRSNLRLAVQETDFAEVLKQRLAASKGMGPIEFTAVTSGAASAPTLTSVGAPVGHVIALEYRLNVYGEHLVNPEIGVHVRVTAQVQSPDRKQLIHHATWTYCGDRYDFVQMGADDAAAFRAQINVAAAVLGEAIPYDLYVSKQPRPLKVRGICMDFSDLPSRTGQQPAVAYSPSPPQAPAPQATTAAPSAAPPTQVASTAPATDFDGTWTVEMQISTNAGGMMGGECPARHSATVALANGNAEGPWGKLQLSADGEASGWMRLPPTTSSTMVQLIVNLSGRMDNGVVNGTMTGRCTGNFVMRKQ